MNKNLTQLNGRKLDDALDDLVKNTWTISPTVKFIYKGPQVKISAVKKDRPADNCGLFLLSDLHIGTLLENYETTYQKREKELKNVVDNLLHVIRLHYPVKTLYICLMGDMMQGQNNYPHQVSESDSQWKQVKQSVKIVINEIIRLIDNCYKEGIKINVVEVCGSHGKTSQFRSRNRDSEEMIVYSWINSVLEGRYQDIQIDCDINYVLKNIEGLDMLFEHGDSIKMYQNLPYYGIGRRIDRMRGRTGVMIKVYNMGHFHSLNHLRVNDADVFMTGTLHTDSDLSYTLGLLPDERFWFYTCHKGRIGAQFEIWADKIDHEEFCIGGGKK